MAKKKFTQQELEEALEQIQDEQKQEDNNAYQAAQWLQQQLGFGTVYRRSSDNYGHATPRFQIIKCVLSLVTETYGPHMQDYINALAKIPNVKPGQWVYGFDPKQPFYEITTPYGDYTITFEYFDNHCTGY